MNEPRVQITLNVSPGLALKIESEALRLGISREAVLLKAFNLLFDWAERDAVARIVSKGEGVPLSPRDAKRTTEL